MNCSIGRASLTEGLDAATTPEAIRALTAAELIEMSASTGRGMETLLKALEARLSENLSEDSLTVERHVNLAQSAAQSLGRALVAIEDALPLDMVSLDLKQALEALSEITAENATETLISEIFAKFCVGK